MVREAQERAIDGLLTKRFRILWIVLDTEMWYALSNQLKATVIFLKSPGSEYIINCANKP